jgi:arginine repressor
MASSTRRTEVRGLTVVAILALAGLLAVSAAAQTSGQTASERKKPVEHALVGTVDVVDTVAKTVAVKTADGTVEVCKVTEETTVTGLRDGAKYTALGAEKGAHVVVRYSEEGGKKTASGIDTFGKGTGKAMKATVVAFDNTAKTVTVRTAKGAEEVIRLSDRATVETGKGVAKGVKKGTDVTVYYTEDAGKKIAHFLHF